MDRVTLRGTLDDTLRQQTAIGGASAALQAEIDRLNHVVGLTPRSGSGVVIILERDEVERSGLANSLSTN